MNVKLKLAIVAGTIAATTVMTWMGNQHEVLEGKPTVGYVHPCAEDEYVNINGVCVHVDDIFGR
jgi:hypothetical protein